ncbi:MAG: NADH-quinone oxidoreductase subunit NuoH [Acidimicrobiales bacterium]
MMNVVSGLDPLFLGDASNWEIALIVGIKVVVVFVALMVSVMLMVWWERKFISDLQNRIGPNRAGPFGILQTLADGIKLFFKEDSIPGQADRFVFKLAPYLSIVPAFLVFAVVPVAGDFSNGGDGTVTWFGNETFVQLADPHMGILFVLAMSSLAVYGVMLAGWSSGSKYPLLGSVRASAQMVSYEVALGLALVAVLLKTGSLSTYEIVRGQAGDGPSIAGLSFPDWNVIVLGVVPFVIFFVATTAELNRPPFDLVEAEQELVGGFHTEYSSIRFALFFLAEFMNLITMSAVMVTLFFGGPAGPNLGLLPGWLWGFVWFLSKLFLFVSTFVWMRGTLPRLRYDQLMDLGWKVLTQLALAWVLFLAALDIFNDRGQDGSAERLLVTGVALSGFFVFGGLLMLAIRSGKRVREREGEEVFG